MKCTYRNTALSVPTQLGPEGDMRCRGVLAVIVNLPEMHIPPWYWFRATLRSNVMRREEHAAHNAALWVSRCQGLNIEILWGIANATSSSEINALVQEVGDYDGPVSLLRDTAQYLAGLRPWRKAFRPVLDVAGWRG